jgi:hypothetical protein
MKRGGPVSKWLSLVASAVLALPVLPCVAMAQTTTNADPAAAEAARPAEKPNVLPTITVRSPRRLSKARQTPTRDARTPPVTSSTAATTAAPPAVFSSGAPNVGSGPAGAPNMASQLTVSGEDLNARPVTRPGEVLEAVPAHRHAAQRRGQGQPVFSARLQSRPRHRLGDLG